MSYVTPVLFVCNFQTKPLCGTPIPMKTKNRYSTKPICSPSFVCKSTTHWEIDKSFSSGLSVGRLGLSMRPIYIFFSVDTNSFEGCTLVSTLWKNFTKFARENL